MIMRFCIVKNTIIDFKKLSLNYICDKITSKLSVKIVFLVLSIPQLILY